MDLYQTEKFAGRECHRDNQAFSRGYSVRDNVRRRDFRKGSRGEKCYGYCELI